MKLRELTSQDMAKVKQITKRLLTDHIKDQDPEEIIPLVMALGMALGFCGDTFFKKASPEEFGQMMGRYVTATIENARRAKQQEEQETANEQTDFTPTRGWGIPN